VARGCFGCVMKPVLSFLTPRLPRPTLLAQIEYTWTRAMVFYLPRYRQPLRWSGENHPTMPPLFRSPCLKPSPGSNRQQEHGGQVVQQVKNVEWLGQRPLKQHARLLHQVGLWINWRDGHPNREKNQQGKGNPINPTHKSLSFSNFQLYPSFAWRLRCKRMAPVRRTERTPRPRLLSLGLQESARLGAPRPNNEK
jgi:hypothetical protein